MLSPSPASPRLPALPAGGLSGRLPVPFKWAAVIAGAAGGLGLAASGSTPWLAFMLIAAAAAAAGGLVSAGLVRRPHPSIGLLILLLAVPLRTLAQVEIGEASVGITEAALPVALFWTVAFRRPGPFLIPRPALLLVTFIGLAALTALWAVDLTGPFVELAKWLEALVALLACFDLARNPRDLKPVALLAGAALAAEAAVGLLQTAFALGPQSFLVGVFLRAYGTFEQPNPFAGYLVLQLPFALALALTGKGAWRWAALALWVVGIAAVTLSLSRGAWLGLAAGTGLVLWYAVLRTRISARTVAAVGVALLVLAALANLTGELGDLLPRRAGLVAAGVVDLAEITEERSPVNFAVFQRLAFWNAATGMFLSNPLGGVGLGNFDERYPDFRLGRWDESLGHAHNFYLNVAAETGLAGLAPFLAFLAFLISRARRASLRAGPLHAAALGAFGSVAAFAVHNLVDSVFVGGMGIIFGAAAGLALAAHHAGEPARAARPG